MCGDINSFAALTDMRGNKTNERASQNSWQCRGPWWLLPWFSIPRMLGSVRFGGGDSFAKLSAQTNRNESQMNITQVQLNGHK